MLMKILVESKNNVIGRGIVFMVDLNKNNLNEPPKIGDKVTVDNIHYVIKGLEVVKGIDDNVYHIIGINVKPI